MREIAQRKRLQDSDDFTAASEDTRINQAHEAILRALLEDDGEDKDLAKKFLEESECGFELKDAAEEKRGSVADAFVDYSKRKLMVDAMQDTVHEETKEPTDCLVLDVKLRRER